MIIGEYQRRSVMLSAVTRIERSHDFKKAIVHTKAGEFETFDGSDFDAALRQTVQASFESNGAQLVTKIYDDNMKPCDVELRAILGFYLDATGELRAVTMDGNMGDETVILFADGHVEAFEESWRSLDDYKKQLIEDSSAQRLFTSNE